MEALINAKTLPVRQSIAHTNISPAGLAPASGGSA